MSAVAVHQMAADLAPAGWPRLNPEDVQAVLERFGSVAIDAPILWHSPRPFSAAAIVASAGRRLFLKRHHRSVRSAPELAEEHRFIEHLHAHNAPVNRVLAAADGATAVELDDWTYEIHPLGAGIDLYADAVSWSPFVSADHAAAAGRALAALHIGSRGFDAPPRSARLLVSNDRIIRSREPLRVIHEIILARPALRDYFQSRKWRAEIARAIAPFHGRFLDALPYLEPLWTHNDWHASNLLWSDASATASVRTVFDFSLSDRTTAEYDLATAIERNTIPWLDIHQGEPGPADLKLASGLVRGYIEAHPLGRVGRPGVTAVLPLVHVGYALTEIDYFYGAIRSTELADLAYHEFLLGHCAWFESVQGRALLDHLSRELEAP